ncbi:MAG TPA: hypothetical protein VIA06_08875 [Candidatus Dormibacteraeota bacterium]|nr:hypothetical protein [Candidatus Dormibacteraeota bacterium]
MRSRLSPAGLPRDRRVDYGRFRSAWIPDQVFPDDPRRRVLSAVNLRDPQELLTLA